MSVNLSLAIRITRVLTTWIFQDFPFKRLSFYYNLMTSPFVAAGIALLGIIVMAAILSASANQMQFSVTAADSIAIQNDKVKENIKATLTEDGQLEIKNDWGKTTRIKEIRIIDDNGNVVLREALNAEIGSFRTSSLDSQAVSAISQKVNSLP